MPAKTGRRYTFGWLVLAFMLLCGSASAQKDLSVEVTLTPDTVGLDDQAFLEVVVSGQTQTIPDVEMPSLPSFEVYSQGRSSSISIVNGQVNASVQYRYLLLPQKPGVYPISGVSVTSNGKRVEGNTVTLVVENKRQKTSPRLEDRASDGQGGSRDYFLEASIDKKNPYVGEQVTLTLKFYIAVQYYSSPELDEPQTTGFWTEVVGNSAPYFQRVGNRNYRVIERRYALFPTQTGDLSIGRAVIRTTVASRRARHDPYDLFGDLFPTGEGIEVRSDPLTLTVKPLPEAGKPGDFTGTVGRFEMTATADRTEVEMNQPVTVTIKIAGTGNVKSVGEPVIPESSDFRIYRASSSEDLTKFEYRIGGTKTYEEVFIPKHPGKLEIPSLRFNYFDPVKSSYATLTTQAIALNVTKAEGYVASPDVPYSGPSVTVGSQSQDIRFIKEHLTDLQKKGDLVLFSPVYLMVNSLPIVALVGLVVIRKRREMLSSNVGLARSRSASSAARKRLAKAKSLASVKTVGEFYGEISLAVTAYIADKLNISPHGLTSDRIAELLREKRASEDLIADTLGLLRQCDFARFAPASLTQADIENSLTMAESIMVRMEGVKFA